MFRHRCVGGRVSGVCVLQNCVKFFDPEHIGPQAQRVLPTREQQVRVAVALEDS